MNELKIKGKTIGAGRPLVCVPVMERESNDIIKEITYLSQSRADMISKFEIALKEANETENWLTIFKNAKLIDESVFEITHNKLVKIKIRLISSIKTLKSKQE